MMTRVILSAVAATSLGCHRNQGAPPYEACGAFGEVTFEGRPLATGMVTFVPQIPESAGGHPGIASIETAGKYRLGNAEHGRAKSLRPGEYVVTVVAMDVDYSRGKPAPKLALPQRYADQTQTPLRVTLNPGDNRVDLRLVR